MEFDVYILRTLVNGLYFLEVTLYLDFEADCSVQCNAGGILQHVTIQLCTYLHLYRAGSIVIYCWTNHNSVRGFGWLVGRLVG